MALALLLLGLGLTLGQIAGFSFSSGVRVTFLDIAVVVVLLTAAIRQGSRRFVPKLWAPILVFFTIALVSSYGNVVGIMYTIRWMLYALLYWVSADKTVPPKVWLSLLLYSAVAIALLGCVQYVLYPDLRNLYYLGWDPHYQRLFSTLLDPNFAGILFVLTSILLVGTSNILWLLLPIGALLLTFSRSSLIAFFVGFFVWGFLVGKKQLILGLLTFFLIVIILLPKNGEGHNLLRTVSSYARVGSAVQSIELIKEKPLLGHGFVRMGIDTSLLSVAASTGVIGLAAYVWIIVCLFQMGLEGLKRPKTRDFSTRYLAMLVALMVHSLFVNSLLYPWVMVWMWMTTGVLEQKLRGDT